MSLIKYKEPIEREFGIIGKDGKEGDFILNDVQRDFLEKATGRDVILKARQLGFSSLFLAILSCDFLFKKNSRSVVVSHESDATQRLFDRVKFYLSWFERKNNVKLSYKYNSRNEIFNETMNTTFYVGTAGSKSFGRGDTITGLLLSEFAFYPDPEVIFSSVLQAVVPDGKVFIETTANGFNWFKTLWDEAEERGFRKHFYSPSWQYDDDFLAMKRQELKRLFPQEYPQNDREAFLASGDLYFDNDAVRFYSQIVREPVATNYV